MIFKETAKYLRYSFATHLLESELAQGIYEQITYLPHLGVYPNNSDMNESGEILEKMILNEKKKA